ncbi:right-handed parallel beta-helix repeat-containing protein [Klebsiella pneumoniae]|nr:right-handed parallel beta-helix repeat-containing protein [Klebsiella pneumoniae]HBX8427847.1 right-handed parallel beta-helix repeat-containing protein [Klebsiella pneumoniae]HBZ0899375.1 right-handed parallel beta-helix repeat-containing protein [Klebsiella pneumoniae]HBZ1141628.1 right-handed parallel beta-helix repeat-containing protein [Klebsiella pneumoniae]HBZ1379083.1 right-handed parallel beta-helix repeat-containing protein [Klebsiella pneumoniae]
MTPLLRRLPLNQTGRVRLPPKSTARPSTTTTTPVIPATLHKTEITLNNPLRRVFCYRATMSTYKTGNPLGSAAVKDLFDNAENLDFALNSLTALIWTDRLGKVRPSFFGMETSFLSQMSSQESRFTSQLADQDTRFNTFIASSGYDIIGDYTVGTIPEGNPLTITEYNQLIRYNNELYKLTAATDIPFTASGKTDETWTATDSAHFVSVGDAALRQNLGSSDGTKLIGGLPFVTPEMFGSSRGDITHDEAFRLMLAAAAVHPTRTAWAPGDYELFDTHIPPQGVTLIIDGVIKHNPVGDFTWSESNRRSDYSLFLVTESDIAIKGSGRIENKYEAVSVDAGGDNFKFEGVTISNPDRSKSVGLSIYNVSNVSVLNCLIANNGSKGTYVNSSSAGITGRYGNGIDSGGIRGLTVSGLSLIDNGGNGFWCYGVGDLTFTTNWCLMNGVSGMQYGPHPDYDGVNISYNICRENAADGIDINYTGASPVPIAGVFNGNICRRNGFFNSDTTKPTADGSGITLRNVTDYICADNMIRDNNGVGIYCTFAADAHIHDNVIINRIMLSAGMYQGFVSTDVNIHDNRIITKGTAYQEGGSMPVSRMSFHSNKLFSSQAQSVSIPSNTQTDRTWKDNHHVTPNVINFWFSVKDDTVRYTGSTGRAVYINANYGKFRDVTVNGATSDDLVYVDGGLKNIFSGFTANNTGTGRAVYTNNSARLKFADSFIQCAAGTALFCYAGTTVDLDSCDVIGATAISAPLPASGSAAEIKKAGTNFISGTVSTATPVKQVTYS